MRLVRRAHYVGSVTASCREQNPAVRAHAASSRRLGYPWVVAFTPEQLAMLERQRAYFLSDERIEERAEIWRDAPPEERLEATREACDVAEKLNALKSTEMLARIEATDTLPPDAIAILEALNSRR